MNQKRVKILRRWCLESFGQENFTHHLWQYVKKMWKSIPTPKRSMKELARLVSEDLASNETRHVASPGSQRRHRAEMAKHFADNLKKRVET